MSKKQKSSMKPTRQNASKKVGILLPNEVYAVYEQVAKTEYITVAQVIARVAIEFVNVENEASRSRRAILGNYKEELLGKSRPALRQAARRD
jgi:hypothetical protein